jgi:hypothetical protein
MSAADLPTKQGGYERDSERRSRAPARLRTLDDLDGRTRASRLAQQLVGDLQSDLGGDLSAAKQQLVRRAALIGAIAEDAEARWLEGKPVDVATYAALADRQRRILQALGLNRVVHPRDVTPMPDATKHVLQYLRQEGGR